MTVIRGAHIDDEFMEMYRRLRNLLHEEHYVPELNDEGWYIVPRTSRCLFDYQTNNSSITFIPYPEPDMSDEDFRIFVEMCKL